LSSFLFFTTPSPTEFYTLSLHDALPILMRSASGKAMINVATDGETYGHHFKFGDLCLAHTFEEEAPVRGFQVTNYGEYLDKHTRSEEHTSELQSRGHLVCRLLLEKKKKK